MKKDKDIIVIITDDKIENDDNFKDSDALEDSAPAIELQTESDSLTKPYLDMEDVSDSETDAAYKHDQQTNSKKHSAPMPRNLTKGFTVLSLVICAAIIFGAVCTAYFMPKSQNAVSDGLERLKQKDTEYLQAKTDYDTAAAERDSLNNELELKRQALEEFNGAKNSLDKITSSNEDLEKTRDQLKKEVDSKQSELNTLISAQEINAAKITTLNSGSYSVGKDIAEGTYTITGTGSIAIANSGRSIANKLLKADGESFTLKQGDRIQIDGSAKFIPQ